MKIKAVIIFDFEPGDDFVSAGASAFSLIQAAVDNITDPPDEIGEFSDIYIENVIGISDEFEEKE